MASSLHAFFADLTSMLLLDVVARLETLCFQSPWSGQMISGTLEHGCLLLYSPAESRFLCGPPDLAPLTLNIRDDYLGYILAQNLADDLEILRLAIVPEARGRGLGSQMLDEFLVAVRKKRERGHWKILLEVSENNQVARRLYARSGFQPVSRRLNYYPGGEAALILQRQEIV